VSDPEAVSALVDFAKAETGGLHILVNNAGISGVSAPLGDYPLDVWKKVVDINLNGVFYVMRYAIPAVKEADGEAIVHIASMLGSVRIAGSSTAVTAKHGVIGMTQNAAREHAADNIRVTAVGPGFIATPQKRMGTPEEVSALLTFLLSDPASFITGSYHPADGA
jgi:NAD(P)-dependent dehydrogenase (short-subunit alcohol dehydrogenase family)